MPTAKSPRDDADETVVLPAAADETAALPLEDAAPSAEADPAPAEPEPTDEVTTTTPAADETTVLPVAEGAETSVLPVVDAEAPVGETQPLPTADAGELAPAPAETTAAYASPIGSLYTPTERPEPTPTPTDAFFATYAEQDRVDPVAPPAAAAPADPPRRRLRVGTVVWGLVIAAIGVGLLAWAAGVAIDLQLAMIVLLAVAGTALLVGSIVSGARNARR
jgi:hypothetical protein